MVGRQYDLMCLNSESWYLIFYHLSLKVMNVIQRPIRCKRDSPYVGYVPSDAIRVLYRTCEPNIVKMDT